MTPCGVHSQSRRVKVATGDSSARTFNYKGRNPLQVQYHSAPTHMGEPFIRERRPRNGKDWTPHPTTETVNHLVGERRWVRGEAAFYTPPGLAVGEKKIKKIS